MKVSLLTTCLAEQVSPRVAESAARVLSALGCSVSYRSGQGCCGQPAFNSGHHEVARKVAAALMSKFSGEEPIVCPSGSCAGMIRHYFPVLFPDGSEDATRAQSFVSRVYELSEFIVDVLNVHELPGTFPGTVTYHPSCHGCRLLGVREQPQTLLEAGAGANLRPLEKAQDCCGFGGTFAVKMSELSAAMVDEKVDHIVRSGAEFVVSGDLGCLLNIAGRMDAKGVPTRPLHLAEFLERCLLAASPGSDEAT